LRGLSATAELLVCFYRELARIFEITDYEENHLSAILLDLYYYTLQFARDSDFTKDQTSAFFSIVKKTHEACVGQRTLCCRRAVCWHSAAIFNFGKCQ